MLIFWPPGPVPQRKASVKVSSGRGGGRGGICFSRVGAEDEMVRSVVIALTEVRALQRGRIAKRSMAKMKSETLAANICFV